MTPALSYLEPHVAALLEGPVEKRLEYLAIDQWIGYPCANYIIQRMEQLALYPRHISVEHLLIQGRPGNGKTSLLCKYRRKHPMRFSLDMENCTLPAIFVEVPEKPDLADLYSMILFAMMQPHGDRVPVKTLRNMCFALLERYHVRMIVIDEFSNLAHAGKATDHLLAAIRSISNRLKISFVIAGTSTAVNVLSHDPQMARRFTPVTLARWEFTDLYRQFLATYERLLPLQRPSQLGNSDDLDARIYQMTGESIGSTVRLLRMAARQAIQDKSEQITMETLDLIPWTDERRLGETNTAY